MKNLMIIITLSAGLHAVGANWINYNGLPPLLLEDPDNWGAAMSAAEPATFNPPGGTTLAVTTVTGFTNADLTVTAPLSALTFDIPPGRTYSVSNYTQNSSNAGAWSTVTFQGGGDIVMGSRLYLASTGGHNYNSLIVTNGTTLRQPSTPELHMAYNSNNVSNLFLVSNARCEIGAFIPTRSGCYNQAIINDHAVLICGAITIGNASSGSNNVLLIDNASVTNSGSSRVGNPIGADNNCVEVTNGGEWYFGGQTLYIGDKSCANEVRAKNGGKLNLIDIRLGSSTGADRNAIIIEGTDSSFIYRSGSALRVGDGGSTNSLRVLDGASITIGALFTLANQAASSANTLLLSNAQGEIGDIRIGSSGHNNKVIINNGATLLASGRVDVGYESSASNNVLLVDNASMTTSNRLMVGRTNFGNLTEITRGGTFYAHQQVYVGGDQVNARENELKVTHGGKLTANSSLTIGTSAGCSNNTMRVENGTVDIGTTLAINHAGLLTLAGTNPVVTVKASSGTAMTINNSATLRFEFDTVAPTNVLINVTTRSLSVTNPGAMVIDAQKLAFAGGGKNICLVQVGTASGPALTALKDSFDAIASTGRITLRVEDNLRLVCDVAGEGGTLILVK